MDDAWGSAAGSKRASGTVVWTGGEGGAAEAFVHAVTDMVNHKQVYDMLETQSQVYKSLKTSQESLTAFNDFSATLYRNSHRDFERRTKMIKDMQKDLEYIYRKLKLLKGKVEEVTGVPPDVVRATLREMDRAKAAFLGEADEAGEGEQRQDEEDKATDTEAAQVDLHGQQQEDGVLAVQVDNKPSKDDAGDADAQQQQPEEDPKRDEEKAEEPAEPATETDTKRGEEVEEEEKEPSPPPTSVEVAL